MLRNQLSDIVVIMILETGLFLSTLFIISRIYLIIRKLCLSLQQIKAPRQGEYPGMLKSRQFTVVLPDGTTKTVAYDGTRQEVVF